MSLVPKTVLDAHLQVNRAAKQYNEKRELVKDYKYFFYQYALHAFTRQSSVERCYHSKNYNIMVSNKNDATPGEHPDSCQTHRNRSSCKDIQQ